jgi:uncharacterized protein YdiU (UPF0061 family)
VINNNFYSFLGSPVPPAQFPKPTLRWFNKRSAQNLGLESLNPEQIEKHFCRFEPFSNNIKMPLALAYHGHQFRNYNPEIGDGRGFLHSQFLGLDKKIHDLTTKGSGTTPYSRRGDGRLTLKAAIRELLASEMLESMGVNTSQTFCIFETGEELERPDEDSPTRGAVLTRRVHSSIRFGTFQRLAYLQQKEMIHQLVSGCLDQYFQGISYQPNEKFKTFLKIVTEKSAQLAAQLMMTGYVHAVLNTDNMNINGEVFDFGPYRFMPHFNPHFTAAYFDHAGLYSYGRQPESFLWGIQRLAESLKFAEPGLDIQFVDQVFEESFHQEYHRFFFQRLNLKPIDQKQDLRFIQTFFQTLTLNHVQFEKTFFDFQSGILRQAWTRSSQSQLYPAELIHLISKYEAQNPQMVLKKQKPETLYIHEIEALWQSIHLKDDWSLLEKKIERITGY